MITVSIPYAANLHHVLSTPILLILLVFATARVTRLLTIDTIASSTRTFLSRYDWSRELVHCPWCACFWLALVMSAILVTAPRNPVLLFAYLVLAVSHLSAFFATED